MYQIDREKVKQTFAAYTDRYDPSDPKIRLKTDHTYRVADLCDRIARTVPGTDPELAWLSGMLHDIGRFEQIRRYNTFSDAQSVDHASFGADLLFRDGLLDPYGSFDEDCRYILETSIRNHNRFRIDGDITGICESYCHILRDADKIDILRVNFDTPLEDIYNVSTEELKSSTVTAEVRQGFMEGHAVLRSVRKTPMDHLTGHISLVYELVYPESIRIMKEQGYLNRLLRFRSDNEDTALWFETMEEVLRNRGLVE